MQRSQPLIPLSHDHHHGLVFIRRVKSQLQDSADVGAIVAYVLAFWDEDLLRHFEEEEQYIFPLVPDNDLLRMRAEQEHMKVRAIMTMLREGPPEAAALVQHLADLLTAHIRFEERELFPLIEQVAGPLKLAAAGEMLASRTH
jgi:hemerythrin-like domain-containing protein